MKNYITLDKKFIFLLVMLLVPLQCSAAESSVENVDAKTFAAVIEAHKSDMDVVILDIRTPAEFNAGHIAGAVMLDFYSKSFAQDFDRLDRNKTYLVYCRSGNRSGQLMRAIKNLGFKKIYNMERGLVDWVREGYPLTTS